MLYIPYILAGVRLNAAAQLLLKKGMMSIGSLSISSAGFLPFVQRVLFEPFVIAGLGCYVISVGIWMFVLSKCEVSFAYPFLSIGYVVTAVGGYYMFSESLTITRILGILTICLGVVLISKTA